MSDLEPTNKMVRRPVYERHLRRKHHVPLAPPTPDEIADATRFLWDDDWFRDELREEAQLILEEAEREM